jgi:hypothetical protein
LSAHQDASSVRVFPRYLDGFAPRDYLAEPLAAEADNVARRRVATIFESDGVTLVAALAPSGQNLMFGSHLDGFANDDNWDVAAISAAVDARQLLAGADVAL